VRDDLQSVLEPTPWHPDADQLTAFAEQALPRHEREQTLAHLAVCGACRETVFLAQQAAPEAAVQAAPVRRRWFAGWNLVWPAVAALTAVAGFSVYLQQRARVERPVPSVAVAQVEPEQRLPAVAAGEPAQEAKKPAQTKKRAPAVSADKMPAAKVPAPLPPGMAAHGELNGRLAPPKPAIAVAGAAGTLAGSGLPGQRALARAQPQAAAPVNMPPQSQGALASGADIALAQDARQAAPLARLQAGQGAAVVAAAAAVPPAAPLPAPPPPAPPSSAPARQQARQNDAVTVEAAAANLSDIPATSDNSAKFAALLPELPSHLEMVSSISNGTATVAVDAGGAVFESRDEGKHWKTVEGAWSGRPVKVALEESRAGRNRAAMAAAPVAGLPAEDALERRRVSAGDGLRADQAELHGTVMDQTGAMIPGAKVQVRAAGSTDAGRTVQADGQGRFAVAGLAAGRYEVVIASPGFAALTRVLNLDAGVETGMNATLVVGAMAEAVTVESDVPTAKVAARAKVKAPAFQLTTDTGAVWVSNDGRSWKRR
jgi:hypothetical protein